jgi:hypothetical protein
MNFGQVEPLKVTPRARYISVRCGAGLPIATIIRDLAIIGIAQTVTPMLRDFATLCTLSANDTDE